MVDVKFDENQAISADVSQLLNELASSPQTRNYEIEDSIGDDTEGQVHFGDGEDLIEMPQRQPSRLLFRSPSSVSAEQCQIGEQTLPTVIDSSRDEYDINERCATELQNVNGQEFEAKRAVDHGGWKEVSNGVVSSVVHHIHIL
jgi:hypothetical protein